MINDGFELDENIIHSSSAIYRIQRILGSARVKIKNKCIYSNTIYEKLYSVCWLIAATVSIVYFQIFYYSYYYHKSFILYVACAIGVFAQYLFCLVNVLYDKMLGSAADIEIYFYLKKVNKELKLNHCTYIAYVHNYINIIFLMLVVVLFPSGYCLHVFYGVNKPYYTLFMCFPLLAIYVDIIVVGHIIVFLGIRLGFINDLLIKYIANTMPDYTGSDISRSYVLQILLEICAIEYNKKCKYLPTYQQYIVSLRYILKCYKTLTQVYSLTVLIVAAAVSTWTYIIIGTAIITIRTQLYSAVCAITVAIWAIFYFVQLIVLAHLNDNFIKEVKNMKLLCIQILSYDIDDTVTKMASECLREIKYSQPSFSVYGIFTLDTRIPIHLVSLITANIMIIIQFSY